MQARKALTTLACAYVVLCGSALARERMPSPTPSQPSIFPDTFVSIQLGMPQAELLRVRPAISTNAFKGDNTGHAKLLFEKVRSEFIEQVIYLFDETKPILVGVMYLKPLPTQSATRLLPAFRTAVLKKWGVPDSTKYGRAQSGAREVALVWWRKDAVIVASYPAGDQTSAPGVTSVRIGRRNSIVETYANQLERMENGEQGRLLRELSEQLRNAPVGVTYQ